MGRSGDDVVFLDANVLFSLAYRTETNLHRLLERPHVRLVTSPYAAEEARRNLPGEVRRSELARILDMIDVLPRSATDMAPIPDVDLPEKDRPILWGAIGAGATHLLTGDTRHFGDLYSRSVRGVLILRPASYLRLRDE